MVHKDPGSDDPLPWLEPADDEEREATLISGRKLMIAVIALLSLIALVAALIYAQVAKPVDVGSASGEVALIRAPDSPFKQRPDNAGGLVLAGENDTIYQAADGADPGGRIAVEALPEEPIARPGVDIEAGDAAIVERKPPNDPPALKPTPTASTKPPAAEPKPVRSPKPNIADAVPAKPADSALRDGLILQLGAFSSEAKANAAWKEFTTRYSYLSGLEKSVAPLVRDGKTLYRLHATGLTSVKQANDVCGRLKVAGEQCAVTD